MHGSDFVGCTVRVEQGEYIDSALRRFKKALQRCNIAGDLRRHEHHVPPSERRRMKSAAARKRRAQQ